MRIAICDNEKAEADIISAAVKVFIDKNKACSISSEVYLSGADLLASIQIGCRFDIYLLDIIMPGLSGMELAKIIRTSDSSAKMIFLTSSRDFAIDSYTVNAYYYLLKPIDPGKLEQLLQEILNSEDIKPRTLSIKTASGYANIDLKSIEYVEVIGRTLRWALSGGKIVESVGRLLDIEAELTKYPEFIKPHRSYIVNMLYIDILDAHSLKTRSFRPIPIARNTYQLIKTAYIGFNFMDGGVK